MDKRMVSSLISALVFIGLFGFIIWIMVWANNEDPLPTPIFYLTIVLLIIPIIGILINLGIRIKEIRGGEEDEASKY